MERTRSLPRLAALVGALFVLGSCEHETVPTVVDTDVAIVDVVLTVSEFQAATGAGVTVALDLEHDIVESAPGALQGSLSWDPSALRYLGQIDVSGAQTAVNDEAADAGTLRIAVIDQDGFSPRLVGFGFEVLRAGYPQTLSFDTDVLADLNFAAVDSRDLRGVRSDGGLPPATAASRMPLAQRLTGLPLDTLPTVRGPSRIPGTADVYGDGNEDGSVNVLDALYAAHAAVGNPGLGPCVAGTASPPRDCLAINVEPANLPGLGESTDSCPPGVENACAAPLARVVDVLDWLAIAQEVTERWSGPGHPIVGEPIPNARGGTDRTSPADTVVLSNPPVVTDTLVFSADTLYILDAGELVVGDEAGTPGTVIFEPGVVFEAVDSTTGIRVTRNGRIIADGTGTEPITFSCRGPNPAPGCWRGLSILGSAVVNVDLTGQPAPAIPVRNPGGGGNEIALDTEIVFGGSNDADDSGVLRYVRVLYAGTRYERGPGDFTLYSGLRIGACGSGTVLDHIQAHASGQDGIQILGGRCSLSHVIVSEAADDLFDISWGYDGDMQYVVAVHGPGGDKAYEVDNTDGTAGPFDAAPRTTPRIWNLTLVGGSQGSPSGQGLHWRRGALGEVRNALLVETATPFRVDDATPGSCDGLPANGGGLTFENIIVLGRDATLSASVDCAPALATYVGDVDNVDDRTTYGGELVDPFSGWLPDLRPVGAGVPSGTITPGTPPSPLDAVAYVGAVEPAGAGGSVPWYAGWLEPWEPLPPSLQPFRATVSCTDRFDVPEPCTVIVRDIEINTFDTLDIGVGGVTIPLHNNHRTNVTGVDSTGFWQASELVEGGPGDVAIVVLRLEGSGGEFCGGAPESFNLVTVRPMSGCLQPGVVSTVEEAVFLASEGGTIELGQGEHRGGIVRRDGLTFRRVAGEDAVVLTILRLLGGGAYEVRDLTFRGNQGTLFAGEGNSTTGVGDYASILVEDVDFEGDFPLYVSPSTVPGAFVTIQNSRFTGRRGVRSLGTPFGAADLRVLNNQFTDSEWPITFTDYGGNSPFVGIIEGNSMVGDCGSSRSCIDLRPAGNGTIIRGNSIVGQSPWLRPAVVAPTFQVGDTLEISGNVITGGYLGGDSTLAASWAFPEALQLGGSGTTLLSSNAITGVHTAINHGSGRVHVIDQVIDGVYSAIESGQPDSLTIDASDVTNFQVPYGSASFPIGNLSCNWWGDVGGPGPSAPDGGWAASPWASGPVANGAGGACDQFASVPAAVRAYPMDGSAADTTGLSADGTLVGDASFGTDRFAQAGMALALDGTGDYVDIDFPTLSSQSFSVCAWVNQTGTNATVSMSIVGGRTGSTTSILYLLSKNQSAQTLFAQTLGLGGGPRPTLDSGIDILGLGWQHVCLTSGPSDVTLYQNGTSIGTVGQTTLGNLPATPHIGAYYDSSVLTTHFFNGLIDDVLIFDQELTSQEVQLLSSN